MSIKGCNCPPIQDVMRGRAGETKPPCPVHDTPERLAALDHILPAIRFSDMRINTQPFAARKARARKG
jgi:hypothetical protein